MAYNDILGKAEEALASIIEALALTGERAGDAVDVDIVTGVEDEERRTPFVALQVDDTQDEVVKGTGIFRVHGRAIIESNEGETLSAHRERVGAVCDALMYDDIAEQLSAAVADFHCYEMKWLGSKSSVDGNSMRSMFEFQLVACCATIT